MVSSDYRGILRATQNYHFCWIRSLSCRVYRCVGPIEVEMDLIEKLALLGVPWLLALFGYIDYWLDTR